MQYIIEQKSIFGLSPSSNTHWMWYPTCTGLYTILLEGDIIEDQRTILEYQSHISRLRINPCDPNFIITLSSLPTLQTVCPEILKLLTIALPDMLFSRVLHYVTEVTLVICNLGPGNRATMLALTIQTFY